MDRPTTPFDREWLAVLGRAIERLERGFAALPRGPDGAARLSGEAARHVPEPPIERVLLDVAERLGDNYPYFHPLYAGQMLKPPHPVARLAYALALILNPNNHALD